ncbi:MAG: dihydrolipoyl dehydrogenase [Pseudomonadota bacterium]
MSDTYDLIVIGGGPGGYVAAIRGAQLGLKTACVEMRETLGGTCLNVGCIPSKALLESSHYYFRAKHEFASHGISFSELSFNLAEMIKRKNEVVSGMTGGVEFLFKKNKVTWLKGMGSIVKPGLVKVTAKDGTAVDYVGKNIMIATGSEPIAIPSAPFDHQLICDSTDALNWSSVPKHLVVVGGGVIGLEMASIWSRLGAKVTVLEALDKILGPMDRGISTALQKILEKEGITFELSTLLESTKIKGSSVGLTAKKDGKTVEFEADKVLVAVGRRPYTERLGLLDLGVELDARGRVKIDTHFKTNVPGIYAIGDAVQGPMLAHKAEEEGIAASEGIAGKAGHVNYEAIPGVVYTWPEVASVGATEEELKAKDVKYKKGQFNFRANGRAKAMGDSEGFVKVLADEKTDRLLGVHIIGPNASELIGEVAIAFEFGASAEDLARAVHAHPTLTEAIKEASLGVDGRMIHS